QLACNPSAHSHKSATETRGKPQADGWLAVVPEQAARRILIATLQSRNVLEKELTACTVGANHQLKHFFSRGERALRVERRILRSDADTPAVGGNVLRLQLGVDLLLIDAELRQPRSRDFQENGLLLRAEELDTLDARDQ